MGVRVVHGRTDFLPEAGCTLRKFSALTTPLSVTPAVAMLLYTVIQLVCLLCVYSALNVVISEPARRIINRGRR